MADTSIPQIAPEELAQRLDQGEHLQLLDVRAPDQVAEGHVAFGAALDFHSMPNSKLFALPSLEPLALDAGTPVAVICGHGNSSKQTAAFLRARGFEAYSVTGGMAAWETVYVARALASLPSIERVIQLDRIGKGALSYVLVSDGDAVIVDPGRHVARYTALVEQLRAKPVAVIDTHIHADYLSGARALAARWGVPYFVHLEDTVSPYDGTPGRLISRPLNQGDTVVFGRATLRAAHTPGHTLGSLTLIADDSLALTGDFIFVRSIGRPDLGGKASQWARLLWKSLERARREWPGDLLILPAHYSTEAERRADRSVGARFDVITATNPPFTIQDERAFLQWVADNQAPAPEAYRTIKLANLGLVEVSEPDAELLESGPNLCAVGR